MGLVLGLKAGQEFKVKGCTFNVSSIVNKKKCVVKMVEDRSGCSTVINLTQEELVEVLPDVKLCLGLCKYNNEVNIIITAPREFEIEKPSPWGATVEVKRSWEENFPAVPVSVLYTLASRSVYITETKAVYGDLMFEILPNKKIVGLWLSGSRRICTYCYNTGIVQQWDDLEGKLINVPCHC